MRINKEEVLQQIQLNKQEILTSVENQLKKGKTKNKFQVIQEKNAFDKKYQAEKREEMKEIKELLVESNAQLLKQVMDLKRNAATQA